MSKQGKVDLDGTRGWRGQSPLTSEVKINYMAQTVTIYVISGKFYNLLLSLHGLISKTKTIALTFAQVERVNSDHMYKMMNTDWDRSHEKPSHSKLAGGPWPQKNILAVTIALIYSVRKLRSRPQVTVVLNYPGPAQITVEPGQTGT